MIWDAEPWRRELLRTGERLSRRIWQRRWPSASLAAVERDVMIGAYAVRKLLDAQTKVPHAVRDKSLTALCFRALPGSDGGGPDLTNWHELERWFDFNDAEITTLTPREACNQIIHSWVFMPMIHATTNGLDAIFVSSDRERRRRGFGLPVTEIASLFIAVGRAEVVSLRMSRDRAGQWIVDEALDSSGMPNQGT